VYRARRPRRILSRRGGGGGRAGNRARAC